MGELMRGAMGLGNVQHGEFTVQQDGKAVVMTLQRGTVTKSSATSVTVKSDDDFTGTYVLSDDTRGRTEPSPSVTRSSWSRRRPVPRRSSSPAPARADPSRRSRSKHTGVRH